MLGLDCPFQSGGGSSVGDSGVEYLSAVGIGDRIAPFRFVLFGGDLSGKVGGYRSVSEELSRVFVETGKSGQVDTNIDCSSIRPSGMVVTGEKVDEDVGAELVHRPGTVVFLQVAGETVQFSADRDDTVGGQTVGVEFGGPVGGSFDNNPTFFRGLVVSLFCFFGVGLDTQPADTRC